MGVLRFHPVRLFVHNFSQKPLIKFLDFWYDARGQFSKADRAGFLMKIYHLVIFGHKWPKMAENEVS